MLSSDRRRRSWTVPLVNTPVVGVARTLLALSLAGTLAFSSTDTLFRPVNGIGAFPLCQEVQRAGAFCLGQGNLTLTRWLCVAVLLVVASGWRPRFTGLPLAFIAFSVTSGISIVDGGDQVATNLSLLLAITSLADRRRWHWQAATASSTHMNTVAYAVMCLAKVQVVVIYLQSSIAKMPHAEWADGTAVYYWANHSVFGAPSWLAPLVAAAFTVPITAAVLTWGPIALELLLAAGLLFRARGRLILLAVGFTFHAGIGLVIGLPSFAMSMWAALLVLLVPLGAVISLHHGGVRVIPQELVHEPEGEVEHALQRV